MQVAQNVTVPTTVLKKYKKVFLIKSRVFLHVVKKDLNEKKNLGIFESHNKIGQLKNKFWKKKWLDKRKKNYLEKLQNIFQFHFDAKLCTG